ncbi:MAG: chemotaxis protein CheW [Actinomycetes bacterium]
MISIAGLPAEATVVTFQVGDTRFGLDVACVRRMVRLPELSATEEMPPFVVGVFNLQGVVVPVVDLRTRLGHDPVAYGVESSVVVLETSRGPVAVLADSLSGVSLALPLADARESQHELVAGTLQAGDGLLVLLDAEQILPTHLAMPASLGEAARHAVLPDPDAWPQLRERARGYAITEDDRDVGEARGLAVVQIDDELFGFSLEGIREFCGLEPVTPIPCCPPHVRGSMNLRGELVTVMDIRRPLGIAVTPASIDADLIICEIDDLLLGICVSAVIDVHALESSQLLPPPAASMATGAPYLKGEVAFEGMMLTLVDLPALLTEAGLEVDEVVH